VSVMWLSSRYVGRRGIRPIVSGSSRPAAARHRSFNTK
jgi:hypothetical protein